MMLKEKPVVPLNLFEYFGKYLEIHHYFQVLYKH